MLLNKFKSVFLSSHDFSKVSYKYLFKFVLYDFALLAVSIFVCFLALYTDNDLLFKFGGFFWSLSIVFFVQDNIHIILKWWCDFYGKKTYPRLSCSQSQEKKESEDVNR